MAPRQLVEGTTAHRTYRFVPWAIFVLVALLRFFVILTITLVIVRLFCCIVTTILADLPLFLIVIRRLPMAKQL